VEVIAVELVRLIGVDGEGPGCGGGARPTPDDCDPKKPETGLPQAYIAVRRLAGKISKHWWGAQIGHVSPSAYRPRRQKYQLECFHDFTLVGWPGN